MRLGGGRLIVRPLRGNHCYIEPGCFIEGAGSLYVGQCWKGSRPVASELKLMRGARLSVAGRFVIYSGASVAVSPNATLQLGSGYISNDVTLHCFRSITIGHKVAISKGVTILDSDSHSINGGECSAPIVIGDGVWIGMNVTILKGVCIGDGAIVAAGAVVTKNVSAGVLVAGVPARVIKTKVKWQ